MLNSLERAIMADNLAEAKRLCKEIRDATDNEDVLRAVRLTEKILL